MLEEFCPTGRCMKKKLCGEIVSGFVNKRKDKEWDERVSDLPDAVLVIRRRAEHKKKKA